MTARTGNAALPGGTCIEMPQRSAADRQDAASVKEACAVRNARRKLLVVRCSEDKESS